MTTTVGGCGKTIADQRALDAHVTALVIDALSDPHHMEQIKRRAEKEAAARQPIEAEIGRLEGLLAYWDQGLNKAYAGFSIVVDPGSVRDTDLRARIRVEPK